MKKGKLIVIEGADGSGKETQSELLVRRLNAEGVQSKSMSFPRYDRPTGRVIGQSYLGKPGRWDGEGAWFGDPNKVSPIIASLYYAADRFDAASEIHEVLNSGSHLVLDRYVESNMGHQGGKVSGHQREEVINFIE